MSLNALIAAGLHTERRWINARLESRDARVTKVPYCAFDPSRKASSTDPATWTDFETARRAVQRDAQLYLGFVFGGGFVGVDKDHCRDPKTGAIEPWAAEIIELLNSYTEISVSGTGVHVICRGSLPPGGRRHGQIEMYDSARYFVMTGIVIRAVPVADRTVQLATLHERIFGAVNAGSRAGVEDLIRDAGRGAESIGPADVLRPVSSLSDDEIIQLATNAANGDRFARLWAGEWAEHGSRSEADLALCSHLAFWTQWDGERIDRLFRRSGLMRPKWNRRDYRERTIDRAVTGTSEAYQPPSLIGVPASEIAYE